MRNRAIPLRSIDVAEASQFDTISNMEHFKQMIPNTMKSNLTSIIGEVKNSEVSVNQKAEVEVFFTQDPALLKQYYDLRHYAYRDENGWKDYNGLENDHDRHGKIVVAIQNGEVVGGMRLMFSDQAKYMSNEIPGSKYNYRDIMTKYDKRSDLIFSEISAIVVAKKNRDRSVTKKMFDALIKESKKHGCHYMFGVGVAIVCREYRMIFKSLGHDVEIVISFPWQQRETYNLARMFPMYTKFQ